MASLNNFIKKYNDTGFDVVDIVDQINNIQETYSQIRKYNNITDTFLEFLQRNENMLITRLILDDKGYCAEEIEEIFDAFEKVIKWEFKCSDKAGQVGMDMDEKVLKFYSQNLGNLKIHYDLLGAGYNINQVAEIMDTMELEWKYDSDA